MGCFQKALSGSNFYPVSRSFLEAVDPPTMFTSSIASGLTNANITQYMVVSATLSDIRGEKKTEKSMSLLQLELTQSSEEVHTPVFNATSPPPFAASGYLITQVANDTRNKAEIVTYFDKKFEESKGRKKSVVSQLESEIAKCPICDTLTHILGAVAHRHDPETWRSIHEPVKMPEATHDSEWLMRGKKRTEKAVFQVRRIEWPHMVPWPMMCIAQRAYHST